MKLLGLSLLLAAVAMIGVAALAQPQEANRTQYQAVAPPQPQATQPVRKTATKLAPLKLPNITAITRALWRADRSVLPKQLTSSENVIRFWERKGRWLRAPRHEKCAEVPWQRSCTIARASLRLHTSLLKVAEKRLKYELPTTNDWVTAVEIAQRPYPGSKWWLLAISDREGGWGPWVWYSGMCSSPPCLWTGVHLGNDFLGKDAVGGQMQFRYSTFIGYYPQMLADLRRRGFIMPDLGWARPRVKFGVGTGYGPWLSPLGQALTAAYMFNTGKAACHWCL